MIDTNDKATQPLPLEQKRGRGRPATGQALSNAERQRRYREAQKAQRNENMHKEVAEDLRAELAKALERIEELEAESKKRAKTIVEQARMIQETDAKLSQRNDNELMKRVVLAEGERDAMGKELAKTKAKLAKAGPTKRRYILQWQDPEKDTWHDDSTGDYGSKAKADAACKAMNKEGFSHVKWRVRERQWV